ncbi:MAG: ABC transporter ATP-binding protein [Solirubrobacterales bacterium]
MLEQPLVRVDGLQKVFRGARREEGLVAVNGISFEVNAGSSLAIVGESGSGKTTTARIIANLDAPTSGSVEVCGRDRTARVGRAERRRRGREVQMVFQDPYSSLDPTQRVSSCLAEVLRLHFGLTREETQHKAMTLLHQVGLEERHARSLPRALSGGERQRVAIARALAAEPQVLILDEAVAALDVSIQAQVLNLLADIREKRATTYVVISHDLGVVRQITERMIVMRNGEILEQGPTSNVLDAPEHPYTRLLRDSVPRPGWKPRHRGAAAEHDGRSS